METTVLTLYCRAADYDAATATCLAPFYGPAPHLLPPLSAAEGFQLAVVIVGAWAIGFYIKAGRRVTST